MGWKTSVAGAGLALASLAAAAQIQFLRLDQPVIEARLRAYQGNDAEREAELKKLFTESGCHQLSEQDVKLKVSPNVICVLPGQGPETIVVGAHYDHVPAGAGVVDNWSGASLLPSLYYSIAGAPRRHTFIFIGFTGEELGLKGSHYYVDHLSRDERSEIHAMVNMDSLGLGHPEVWASHADKKLLEMFIDLAGRMKIQVSGMNVENVGTADSESFAAHKIPRITLHSINQQTWHILHTSQDRLDAIHLDDYYQTYRLISGYLLYLDLYLDQPPPADQPPHTP
jgi:putative aminopeptidase FrvX